MDTHTLLTKLGLAADGATVTPETLQLEDDGIIPNNSLPVLIYRGTPTPGSDAAATFEQLFDAHGWPPQWRYGVFAFQHYHSNAHEVLGMHTGWARIQLGGEQGPIVEVSAGDAVILPAGTGHCCIEEGDGFEAVGAYPANRPKPDLLRADPAEHDAAVERIANVPRPEADPVAGRDGPLQHRWA